MLIDTKINNLLNLISYQVGRNINLTQGAGGNISYKSGDILWIKASGFWLSEALTKQIFIPLDIHSLKAIKTDKNSEKDNDEEIKAIEKISGENIDSNEITKEKPLRAKKMVFRKPSS